MLIEINRTHVRRNLTSESREMFPVFRTTTGWLGKKTEPGGLQEDITGELGVAVIIYFKLLKALMILMLVLSLVSLPESVIISSQLYNQQSKMVYT